MDSKFAKESKSIRVKLEEMIEMTKRIEEMIRDLHTTSAEVNTTDLYNFSPLTFPSGGQMMSENVYSPEEDGMPPKKRMKVESKNRNTENIIRQYICQVRNTKEIPNAEPIKNEFPVIR